MKVLNFLSNGSVGGIEKQFLSIGNVPEYAQIFVIISGAGTVSEAMAEKGMDIRDLTVSHKPGIFSNAYRILRQAMKTRRICLDEQISIIASHHGSTDVYLLSILLKMLMLGCKNVAFIRHFHSIFEEESFRDNNIQKHLYKRLYRVLIGISIRMSDAVIAISKASLSSFVREFSIPECKQNIVYNCIDNSFFMESQHVRSSNDLIRLVYTGRLEKVKGVDKLLEALEILRKQMEIDFHLDIVGDGSERVGLQTLCDKLELTGKVTFRGIQNDVKPYLRNSDIFVHPAQCEEGFGISLVEAMAMGLICVVTPSGGMLEIIVDGKNGFISKDKSAEQIMQTLKKAIEALTGSNCKVIMENAQKTAERFRIAETVKGFAGVYKRVLDYAP